ncbi:MAG: DUF4037 domain-containing protein [Actinobacteria bacterium]|nr:DUF4037 domain-containing protein [Actinomycetota bacterium]
MTGLELAEKLYYQYGLSMLDEKFGAYKHRITVGLVGDGSECYGYDDEISRDHDWGPSFCLWLNKNDYSVIGDMLQKEYDKLPKTIGGYSPRKVSDWGENRFGVFETGKFYKNFIGLERSPNNLHEWFKIPENYLAACTNGKVFYGPPEEFMQIRDSLKQFYPEDIRLKKIAARCMTIAQYGQYNYGRCIKRKEYVAARYAETKFCSDVISMIFLINREYTPFFKWMHRAVERLPVLGAFTYNKVFEIVTVNDYSQKNALIEEVCGRIIQELKMQGLSDSPSDFLLDHGPVIQQKIEHPELRKINVWAG